MKRIISHMPVWIKVCCIVFVGITLAAIFANVLMFFEKTGMVCKKYCNL